MSEEQDHFTKLKMYYGNTRTQFELTVARVIGGKNKYIHKTFILFDLPYLTLHKCSLFCYEVSFLYKFVAYVRIDATPEFN